MSVGDVLDQVRDSAFGTQPSPSTGVVVVTAVVALLLMAPQAWPRTRHLVTIAHEGAHGVVALLSGRRLAGIRLHSDTSGLTLSRGRPTGPGMVLTSAAGYVGPGLMGLGAAYLLQAGHAVGVLWLALVLLALLLLQVRNFYGLWAVLVVGVAVFAFSWWASPPVQVVVAHVGTWFVLLAAPRAVLELHAHRRGGRARTSDADVLARLTKVPGLVWVGVFLVVDLAALVVGGRWLLVASG
ncbi:MAG: putative rane protein [Marmoricola sp.]|nr:putative rane protein [Marmoricola sp.]